MPTCMLLGVVVAAMDLDDDTKQPKSKRKSGLVETRPAALAVCIFIKPGAYEQPWPQGMSDYCNYPVSITPNVPYMIHDNEF